MVFTEHEIGCLKISCIQYKNFNMCVSVIYDHVSCFIDLELILLR